MPRLDQTGLQGGLWRFLATIVVPYFVLAEAWILLSDLVVGGGTEHMLQSLKGTGFVVATSLLLALLLGTEYRRLAAARQELASANAGRRAAHLLAGMGHWELDVETQSFRWTEEAGHLYRCPPGEAPSTMAEYLAEYVEAGERDQLRRALDACARSGGPVRLEIAAALHDGREAIHALVMQGTRIEERGIVSVLCTVQDVTELRQQQRELLRLTRAMEGRIRERDTELARAQAHMKSFTYSIVHDLRAPLRAITGFAQLLDQRHGESLPADAVRYLSNIREASRQMDAMIHDLLELASLDDAASGRQEVQLRDVVDSVLSELDAELAANGARVEVRDDLGSAGADPELLRRALSELVRNAAMYHLPGRAPQIVIRGGTDAQGRVRIAVEDDGIGIAAEHHDKIFDCFQRLHGPEEFPGTGVGLAIAHRAVTRMDGLIDVLSLGQGTAFVVTLPACGNPPDTRPAESGIPGRSQ